VVEGKGDGGWTAACRNDHNYPRLVRVPLQATAAGLTHSGEDIVNTGGHLYQAKCAVCHGAGGKGDGAPIATEALHRIGLLYNIEREIHGRTPEERLAVR